MKDMERYLEATYIDIWQPAIINKTLATFPNPDMPTIIPETCAKIPNMDADMTYLENNNIDEGIHQKLRNNDTYKTDMHKIYIYYFGWYKREITGKYGIRRHLLDGQWVPSDPKEALFIKIILASPHLIPMPGNQSTE